MLQQLVDNSCTFRSFNDELKIFTWTKGQLNWMQNAIDLAFGLKSFYQIRKMWEILSSQ